MDEPEYERVVRPIPSSPATLTLSPKRKRVRPRARPQMHYLLSTLILTVAERRFPVLPRIRLRRSTLRTRIRTRIQSGTFTISTLNQPLRRSARAHDVPLAPRVPDDFHWWCEIEGCHYNIDLLNLTKENLAMLDGETAAKLRLQDWSLSDPWVRLAFKAMVEDHRVKHLESWGLRCSAGSSGVYHVRIHSPLRSQFSLTTSPLFRPFEHTLSLQNPQDPIKRRTSSQTSRSNSSTYCNRNNPLQPNVYMTYSAVNSIGHAVMVQNDYNSTKHHVKSELQSISSSPSLLLQYRQHRRRPCRRPCCCLRDWV
jgi:hypothetical protein